MDVLFDGNLLKAAEEGGVHQPSLHRLVSGSVQTPRRRTLEKIAAAFGVTVEWLLGERDPTYPDLPPWYALILGYNRKRQRKNRVWLADAEAKDAQTRRLIREYRAYELLSDDPANIKIPGAAELFRSPARDKGKWQALRALGDTETTVLELAVTRLREMDVG